MLWVDASCSQEGCSWLAVVHGYKVSFIPEKGLTEAGMISHEVSFIPTECFIRKKLTFQLLFCSLHQSIHSSACCVCSDEDHQLFSNKAFGFQHRAWGGECGKRDYKYVQSGHCQHKKTTIYAQHKK